MFGCYYKYEFIDRVLYFVRLLQNLQSTEMFLSIYKSVLTRTHFYRKKNEFDWIPEVMNYYSERQWQWGLIQWGCLNPVIWLLWLNQVARTMVAVWRLYPNIILWRLLQQNNLAYTYVHSITIAVRPTLFVSSF